MPTSRLRTVSPRRARSPGQDSTCNRTPSAPASRVRARTLRTDCPTSPSARPSIDLAFWLALATTPSAASTIMPSEVVASRASRASSAIRVADGWSRVLGASLPWGACCARAVAEAFFARIPGRASRFCTMLGIIPDLLRNASSRQRNWAPSRRPEKSPRQFSER